MFLNVLHQELLPWFCSNIGRIFTGYQILKFDNIVKIQLGKIMYLYKIGLLPESYNNMFPVNCGRYNTRTKNFFRLPGILQSVFKGLNCLIPSALTLKTLLVYLHSLPNSKLFFWHNYCFVCVCFCFCSFFSACAYFSAFLLHFAVFIIK